MDFKFDNSFTTGNLLTIVTIAIAGAGTYAAQTERISRLEVAQENARATDVRQEADIRELKSDIKASLAELKVDIKEVRIELTKRK